MCFLHQRKPPPTYETLPQYRHSQELNSFEEQKKQSSWNVHIRKEEEAKQANEQRALAAAITTSIDEKSLWFIYNIENDEVSTEIESSRAGESWAKTHQAKEQHSKKQQANTHNMETAGCGWQGKKNKSDSKIIKVLGASSCWVFSFCFYRSLFHYNRVLRVLITY